MRFLFTNGVISKEEFASKFPSEWQALMHCDLEVSFEVNGNEIALVNEIGSPLKIDIKHKLDYHRIFFNKNSKYSQPLAKAVGLKKGIKSPLVVDATGGMLSDTILLMAMGCEVISFERNPVICALGINALSSIHKQNNIIYGNCLEYKEVIEKADCIYFDPMFQKPSEKTAPKKAMQVFRTLVGRDEDALEVAKDLLELTKRLVIKRPIKSTHLLENPSMSFKGKATAYDVYLRL